MQKQGGEIVFPFEPQPAQAKAAMAMHPLAKKKMVGYGGSKFNGKSWTIDYVASLHALERPVAIMIIGHSYKDMKSLHIDPLKQLLKDYLDAGIVKWNATDKQFTVPKWGSIIKFQQVKSDSDAMMLNGQRWDIVLIDEAQKFTPFTLRTLRGICGFSRISSNWATRLGIEKKKAEEAEDIDRINEIQQLWRDTYYSPKLMYCFNWGEKGHGILKRWFWDGCSHEHDPIQRRDKYLKDEKTGEWDENPDDYTYLFASMEDNKIGMDNDPEYVQMLRGYEEPYRTAYLKGDPTAFQGLKYEIHPGIHEIDLNEYLNLRGYVDKHGPFIPMEWELYASIDSGVTCAASLYAKTPEGKSFQLTDYYQKGDMRQHIREIVADWKRCSWVRGRMPEVVFGDRFMFAKREQYSLQANELTWQKILEEEYGLYCIQITSDRVTAAMAVGAALHYEMNEDGNVVTEPLLYFAKTDSGEKDNEGYTIYNRICVNTIDEIVALEADPKRPEDIKHDASVEDHAFDKTKIYLMGMDTPFLAEKKPPKDNPHDGYGEVKDSSGYFGEHIEDADFEDISSFGDGEVSI